MAVCGLCLQFRKSSQVSWTPGDDHGSSITGYLYQLCEGDGCNPLASILHIMCTNGSAYDSATLACAAAIAAGDDLAFEINTIGTQLHEVFLASWQFAFF
eukprot:6180122-Pleurochrysis_carterae.AAC.3